MTHLGTQPSELSAPNIKMTSPGEIVAMVPYLLGFHPAESLVVMVLDDGRVRLTTRFDLAACFEADYLVGFCEMLCAKFPDGRFITLAFSADRELADEALALIEIALNAQDVLESLIVCGDRFWSRSCADEACCPSEGTSHSGHEAIVAEAVGAGLAALSSREQIVAAIRPPNADELGAATDISRIEREISAMPDVQRQQLLDTLIHVAEQPDDQQALQMAVLVQDVGLRDRAWLTMNRTNAKQVCGRWAAVVRKVPAELSLPVICLTGMAAWLSGNGALHVACIERGKALDERYSMLQLLEALNLTAADPAIWDQMPVAA